MIVDGWSGRYLFSGSVGVFQPKIEGDIKEMGDINIHERYKWRYIPLMFARQFSNLLSKKATEFLV